MLYFKVLGAPHKQLPVLPGSKHCCWADGNKSYDKTVTEDECRTSSSLLHACKYLTLSSIQIQSKQLNQNPKWKYVLSRNERLAPHSFMDLQDTISTPTRQMTSKLNYNIWCSQKKRCKHSDCFHRSHECKVNLKPNTYRSKGRAEAAQDSSCERAANGIK